MPRKRDPKLVVPCAECGAAFSTTSQRLRKAGRKHQFCNRACYRDYRKAHPAEFADFPPPLKKADPRKDLECVCAYCGKHFRRKTYNFKKGASQGPFCSRKCCGKWRSENLVGENSPAWKGGYRYEYGGAHWKIQRRKALKRDRHRCQYCGTREQDWGYELDVHHVTNDSPEKTNVLSNLVTLCRKCHSDMHNGRLTYEMVQQRQDAVRSSGMGEFEYQMTRA